MRDIELQTRAIGKANYALKSGKLAKPLFCTNCGSPEKLEMHHDDYNEPLVVEWLCFRCHTFKHHPNCNGNFIILNAKCKSPYWRRVDGKGQTNKPKES